MAVRPITEKVQEARLRWFGHVMRSEMETVAHQALLLPLPGARPQGGQRKIWRHNLNKDLRETGLREEDVFDRSRWSAATSRADPTFGT